MKHIISILSIIFVFASCEKEIQLQLVGSEPQLVIEASVTNKTGAGACQVIISKTVDYYTPGAQNPVKGAEIIISDDQGNTETLTETEDGKYSSSTLEGVPGRTYSMVAKINGQTYTASAEMKPLIAIDSITAKYNDVLHGPYEEKGYLITCHYSDPDPQSSFVGIFVKKNGERGDEIYLSNGLFGFEMEDIFQPGDETTVELRNLSEGIYHYYSTINKISGADGNPLNGSGTPANPVSNISNGALGCFAVYAASVASLTISSE